MKAITAGICTCQCRRHMYIMDFDEALMLNHQVIVKYVNKHQSLLTEEARFHFGNALESWYI